MANFNKFIGLGRLTADIELRHVGDDDTAVADVTLAVDNTYRGKTSTAFIPVTLWGSQAQFANDYLGKGSLVMVEGRVQVDEWEKDEEKYSKLKVVASKLEAMPKKYDPRSTEGGPAPEQPKTEPVSWDNAQPF